MNEKENTRHKANVRASHFFDRYDGELTGIDLYPALRAAFDAEMIKIDKARQKQFKQIKPITISKNRLRAVMADTMVKFLLRASVSAYNNNNIALAKAFSKGKTHFTRGKNSLAPVKARTLKDLMSKNLGVITSITPDDIIEMETVILEFEEILIKPKMAIKDRKASGTMVIPKTLNRLDDIKHQIGNLIHSYLPHLALAWDNTIKVGRSTAIRHISLVIKVVDSKVNVPLRNIKCTISNGQKSHIKYSTKRGGIRFKSLQESIWTVTIEHPEYNTEILERIITRMNQVTRLIIPLTKIPQG
jgi:hypothetical protein